MFENFIVDVLSCNDGLGTNFITIFGNKKLKKHKCKTCR